MEESELDELEARCEAVEVLLQSWSWLRWEVGCLKSVSSYCKLKSFTGSLTYCGCSPLWIEKTKPSK